MGNISQIWDFNLKCPNLYQVIPFEEWPDEFFPTNCWGVVYIMSDFVRNKLLKVKS